MGSEGEGNGTTPATPGGRRVRNALTSAVRSKAERTASAGPKVFEPIQANADRTWGYLGYVIGPLGAVELVDRVFRSGHVVLEWLTAVPVFALGVVLALSIVRKHGQLRVVRVAALEGRPGLRAFQDCFLICAVATAGFASLSALLVVHGVMPTTGKPLPAADPASATFGYYAWHLLDAVPVLDIPNTLRWAEPYQFADRWSSSLLLAYKLLVILPFLQIAALVWRSRKAPAEPSLKELINRGDGG